METEYFEFLVIGGGAAGLSTALTAAERGQGVLLAERKPRLGGILNQCLHRGFGRGRFGDGLTGPAYAQWLIQPVETSGVCVRTGVTALRIDPNRTALFSGREGLFRVEFQRCILATGCRERTIASLPMAGTRPAGIFTAGTAQELMNVGHYSVGNNIVILGSGDIGQIMARQFVLAGKHVVAMIEQKNKPGGLVRNQKECLKAYQIPVLLRTTVDEILGERRIRGVMARDLETGRRWKIPCDTLVTALGLIPDQTLCESLIRTGSLPYWLKLCGNCDYVHDMVESVTQEAAALGASWNITADPPYSPPRSGADIPDTLR